MTIADHQPIELHALTPIHQHSIARILAESFRHYPVMRHVLPGNGAERDRQLIALCEFFAGVRFARAEPVIGAMVGRRLVGTALVSDPCAGASPPEVARMRRALWEDLGEDARQRYEAYGEASGPLIPDLPRLHLNMVGVLDVQRGSGVGRKLVGEVHRLAIAHPSAEGVSLTTEDPANLPFYQRLGYSEIGCGKITEDLTTWVLYRPNQEDS